MSMRSNLEQFQDAVMAALPQAELMLQAGVLAQQLSPGAIAAAIETLALGLPLADVILSAPSDNSALIFELSLRLGIPFVGAQFLDVVETDDADSSGFLEDQQLLQVQVTGHTLAIARGAIAPDSRVLIFRDVLSGGVMTLGLLHLVEYSGGIAVGVAALVEKGYLSGRSRIGMAVPGIEIQSLLILARVRGQVILEKRNLQLLDLYLQKDNQKQDLNNST